jgi:hypothetical protein
LKYPNRAKLALMMFLFLFWILPLFVALLLATIMQQQDFSLHVASISPLFGIGAGSWTALIFAASMAAIFFVLLTMQERRVWETLAIREIAKADDLMNDEADNPFL